MTTRVHIVAVAVALFLAAPAAAQDMERVKALYVAAAYEEALAAMPPGLSPTAGTELEQYRALCLLALGRENDAKATIERLVKAHPLFLPPSDEVSPRMRTLFTDVRTALMPTIAKRAYADAKVAYEAKDRDAALAGFKRTLDLIDSVPEEGRGSLADLRLLAEEFHELAAARPAAPNPAPVAPLAEPSDAGPFVAAVAVRQELPPWNPLDSVSRRTEYVGLLQVQIGADGRVTLARMLKPSHPSYDVAILREARRWVYKPATRGGQPVPSEREIEIKLRPQTLPEGMAGGSQDSSLSCSAVPGTKVAYPSPAEALIPSIEHDLGAAPASSGGFAFDVWSRGVREREQWGTSMKVLLNEPPTADPAAGTRWKGAVRRAARRAMRPIQAIAKFAYDLLRDLF